MKLDTLGVQAFIAIAESTSFQNAAAHLHLSQTALSRRLQKLEAFLGVKLLERTTRSMALTPMGASLLPQARRLMGDLAAALVEIRETGRAMRGTVTMACVPTAGIQLLPQIIRAYSARFPDNRINILDHSSAGVADSVLSREAEFGINVAEPPHADLVSVPLVEDELVLICRDDHALARRRRLRWDQLAPHRLIVAGPVSVNRSLLGTALGHALPGIHAFYEVERSSTAVGLVAEGVAAAIVPRLAVQTKAYPRLRMVTMTEPRVARMLVLLTRRNAHLSPAAQALYDMIREPSR